MAYTPINWQTGDTITAEKMNKMDRGWDTQVTQLFTETVTTEMDGDVAFGELSYSQVINAPTLLVNFNGTDYVCKRIFFDYSYVYGAWLEGFTEYPFTIRSSEDGSLNSVLTRSEGTYTLSVSAIYAEISTDFEDAVGQVVSEHDFRLIPGTTIFLDAYRAFMQGKNVYVLDGETKQLVLRISVDDGYCAYGVGVSSSGVNFMTYQAAAIDEVINFS